MDQLNVGLLDRLVALHYDVIRSIVTYPHRRGIRLVLLLSFLNFFLE